MKLSYCVLCDKTLHQLKKTLPENLKLTRQKRVELVLLMVNESEKVIEQLKEDYADYTKNGRLVIQSFNDVTVEEVYAKVPELAKGVIVMTLRATDFIGSKIHDAALGLTQGQRLEIKPAILNDMVGGCLRTEFNAEPKEIVEVSWEHFPLPDSGIIDFD